MEPKLDDAGYELGEAMQRQRRREPDEAAGGGGSYQRLPQARCLHSRRILERVALKLEHLQMRPSPAVWWGGSDMEE